MTATELEEPMACKCGHVPRVGIDDDEDGITYEYVACMNLACDAYDVEEPTRAGAIARWNRRSEK